MKSSTGVTLSGSFADATGTPTEVGFYYGTSSSAMTSKVKATASTSGTSGSFTADLTGLDATKTYYYRAYAVVPGNGTYALQTAEFTATYYDTVMIGVEASASVTTKAASSIGYTSATISASFADASAVPVEVGFYWGTTSSMDNKAVATDPTGKSGTFSVSLSGLSEGTKYYYKPYVLVTGSGEQASTSALKYGSVQYFYTTAPEEPDAEPAVSGKTWLELPGARSMSNCVVNTMYHVTSSRNYTHCYDKSKYTSLWTAYHLKASHMGSFSRLGSWTYNPKIDESYQVNLKSHSYNDDYSRGHLIPNGSRNGVETMQLQTFHVTNSVPQIQNSFNNGIWSSLENALQTIAQSEEIYIVTGVAFNKVGESKTIKYTTAKDDTKRVPVPNYFYKVVLRVKKSGSTVTDASAVGFWFEHKAYTNDSFTNYDVSVDQIEQWTGFDFFVNVPDALEREAEANEYWTTFRDF